MCILGLENVVDSSLGIVGSKILRSSQRVAANNENSVFAPTIAHGDFNMPNSIEQSIFLGARRNVRDFNLIDFVELKLF